MSPAMDDPITLIVVALIGGAAGLGGAFLGAKIAANSAEADRREARESRFADRIRELGATVIDAGNRIYGTPSMRGDTA